jgi:hypothetical protein
MSLYDLGEAIRSYLEADDGGGPASVGDGSGSNGSNGSAVGAASDMATRQQLRQLSQVTDRLSRDSRRLARDLSAVKNNLQMSALLPMLMNQKLVTTNAQNTSFPGLTIPIGQEFDFKPADTLTELLPVLMLGGLGDGGGLGGSNMALMALAIASSGTGGSSIDPTLLLVMAMMGQNQSSSSDSSAD